MNGGMASVIATTAAAIILAGCSRESRDTAIDRIGKAAARRFREMTEQK